MKKILFVSLLAVIVVSLMGGVALAGGWTSISYYDSHDPDDIYTSPGSTNTVSDKIAIWNPDGNTETTKSPHGSFSSTSNRCRVCHAVHLAGVGSWRLLQDGRNVNGEDRGMDRKSECNFCHGVTGVTAKRPYRPKSYSVKGEHTLNSTVIPDATGTTSAFPGGIGLSCGSCHTVHGGGDLATVDVTAGAWRTRILKVDPNGDNATLAAGFNGRASEAEMDADPYATLSNFCGDCHNQNPNWNTTENTVTGVRANPRSHVQGPTAEGSLEVYGTSMSVAGFSGTTGSNLNGSGPNVQQNTKRGCRGCHAAEATGNDIDAVTATVSAWPHQTKGSKLLFDTYTQGTEQQFSNSTTGTGNKINDADRVLPAMDQLCAKCHRKGGTITGSETNGVGIDF